MVGNPELSLAYWERAPPHALLGVAALTGADISAAPDPKFSKTSIPRLHIRSTRSATHTPQPPGALLGSARATDQDLLSVSLLAIAVLRRHRLFERHVKLYHGFQGPSRGSPCHHTISRQGVHLQGGPQRQHAPINRAGELSQQLLVTFCWAYLHIIRC